MLSVRPAAGGPNSAKDAHPHWVLNLRRRFGTKCFSRVFFNLLILDGHAWRSVKRIRGVLRESRLFYEWCPVQEGCSPLKMRAAHWNSTIEWPKSKQKVGTFSKSEATMCLWKFCRWKVQGYQIEKSNSCRNRQFSKRCSVFTWCFSALFEWLHIGKLPVDALN